VRDETDTMRRWIMPWACVLFMSWGLCFGAEAPPQGPLKPMIEVEEDVYACEPSNNGSFPLWTYGSTILARGGDELFFSATETIAGAPPLNCVRWALMKRTASGWEVQQRDPQDRTREPAPIAVTADGRVFLSVNPTLVPDKTAGPARPLILEFAAKQPKAQFKVVEPRWTMNPTFSEHSYRGLGCDGATGALLLVNVEAYRGQHWCYRDGRGEWVSSGLVEFPSVDSYKGPIPIRFLYPGVALRNGAAHVFTKGGVEDFVKERVEYRLSKKDKVWGRYHLGYCWSPDVARQPLSPWIYAVDVSATAGEVWNCDLWVAPNGDCHLLWRETSIDARLRPKFFSDVPLTTALKHGIMRGGKMVFSQALAQGGEGLGPSEPRWGRFHATENGRLFVFYTENCGRGAPEPGTWNRVLEIKADGTATAPETVRLAHPFTELFMVAGAYGGTAPSHLLEVVGRVVGKENTIRYARLRLTPPCAPEVTVTGKTSLQPGQGRSVTLRADTRDPQGDVVSVTWQLPDGTTAKGAQIGYTPPPGTDRFSLRAVAVDAQGHTGAATAHVSVPPVELAELKNPLMIQAEDFVAEGAGKCRICDPLNVVGRSISYWQESLGHWLEWDVEVPAEGDYVLFARYCTGSTGTRRSLTLDGISPDPAYADIAFANTGGFSGQVDNWAFKKLGPPLRLTPGRKHRVRMTNLCDGLGVDYFLVVPAPPRTAR